MILKLVVRTRGTSALRPAALVAHGAVAAVAAIALAALSGCKQAPPALHEDAQALSYRTRAPVSDEVAGQIAAQAAREARVRAAWSEPGQLHCADGAPGDGKAKFLFGEARLYLGEYEPSPGKFREVDRKDDALMAYAEARRVIDELAAWAKAHGVSWDVAVGSSRGRVDGSGPDAAARKLLAALAAQAGGPAGGTKLAAERARIEEKYQDRRR